MTPSHALVLFTVGLVVMSGGMLSLLNSPLVTMGMVFGSIQLLRYVDLTNPKNVLILRMGYIGSQMLMLLFWTWMRSVVKRTGKAGSESLEYEEPPKPFSGEAPKRIKMTMAEYDALEVGKQLQQIIVGTIIMLILHVWLGMVQPLFLQILLPWKSLVTNPLVQIHLFGFKADGALKRPFKQPGPFSEFMGEQAAEAAVPTVEEKEKASDDEEGAGNESPSGRDKSENGKPKIASRKKTGRKED